MKHAILIFTLLLSQEAWTYTNPAQEAVKSYVQERSALVYQEAALLHTSEELFLDDNLKCFSSYSIREEVGFCRQSGQTDSYYSTFLIIVREEAPGQKHSPLVLEVIETSRISLN